MIRRPPRSTRTDTLFPYTTRFRSRAISAMPRGFPQLFQAPAAGGDRRSEEHTSELQSLMRISYAVFCLKKKTTTQKHIVGEARDEDQAKTNQATLDTFVKPLPSEHDMETLEPHTKQPELNHH